MTRPSSVGITMGDPAGVGPEIVCRALADLSPADRAGIVVFGTKSILERANKLTGVGLSFGELGLALSPGAVPVVDIRIPGSESVRDGTMTAAAGACSYAYIERAVSAALAGDISVIATAPINKEALHAAGYPFEGHTELLAHLTGADILLYAAGVCRNYRRSTFRPTCRSLARCKERPWNASSQPFEWGMPTSSGWALLARALRSPD